MSRDFVNESLTKFSESQKVHPYCNLCSDKENSDLEFDTAYVNFPDQKTNISDTKYNLGKKTLQFFPTSHLANERSKEGRDKVIQRIHDIFAENKSADHWVLEFSGIPERSKSEREIRNCCCLWFCSFASKYGRV